MNSNVRSYWILCLILLSATYVFIRNAWICDDAMITFRTVMNLLHGYGAVFNVGERVQAYTHPLWFALIALGAFIFGNIYVFTLVFSVLIALSVLFILFKTTNQEKSWFWIWIVVLLLSKAFVEYSTSGLENSLSHLMLIGGFSLGMRFFKTSNNRYALASLFILISSYLSRPDLILIVLPFCLIVLSQVALNRTRVKYTMLSLIPVLVWTIFSVIYYGFPFPNTAYAKLNIQIPRSELITQGIRYIFDSFIHDPITLSVVAISLVTALARRNRTLLSIAAGISLYLIYIVWIGGDFMSGRYLTVVLISSVFILNQVEFSEPRIRILGLGIIFAGILSIKSTFLSPIIVNLDYQVPKTGIADEKKFFYPYFGALSPTRVSFKKPTWSESQRGFHRTCGNLGEIGMQSGPSVFIIDICGLSDPFLARLPPYRDKNWRIGHFYRQVPKNYEYLLLNGDENALVDKSSLKFWRNLKMITRDPVFSVQRFIMIWNVNMGLVAKPDMKLYRNKIGDT